MAARPHAEQSDPALEGAPRIADAVQATTTGTVWHTIMMRWAYRLVLLVMRAWWVVARPRSSGVRCVLRRGDAILLVRHGYGDRRWMLPGGRMRRGEAPVVTARREMRQELGIDAGRWTVIGCLGARAGYRRRSRTEGFRRHSTYYFATELSTIAVNPRPAEIAEARWFACGTLPDDRSEALDAAVALGWVQARAGADRAEGPPEELDACGRLACRGSAAGR